MGKYAAAIAIIKEFRDDAEVNTDAVVEQMCRDHAAAQGYTPVRLRRIDWHEFTQADIDLGLELFANSSRAGDWRAHVVIEVEEDEPLSSGE